MILSAYFDESGTHAGSPITVMAGVVASAAKWRRFNEGLRAIQKRYQFTVFHGKEFKARSGEFKGWPPEKCIALANEMALLTGGSGVHGTIMSLNNAEFDGFYRGGETPRQLRLDTRYALAFRSCLLHITLQAAARLQHHKKFGETRLHVILESGHANAGDAIRAFEEEASSLRGLGCNILAGIRLASKNEGPPLMVADFLAYTRFQLGERDFGGLRK